MSWVIVNCTYYDNGTNGATAPRIDNEQQLCDEQAPSLVTAKNIATTT